MPLGRDLVLFYIKTSKEKRVIAFAHRSLTTSEKDYPVLKLEFLSLKWAITDKFNEYSYGAEFQVFTDNNPLTYVLTTGKLDATGHRWVAALSSYTLNIIYKPGKSHQDADTLSRIQWPEVMEMNSQTVRPVCDGVQTAHGKAEYICHFAQTLGNLFRNIIQLGMTPADWSQAQYQDPIIKQF